MSYEFIEFFSQLNKWCIKQVSYFKPNRWTFYGAVRMYKEIMRHWIDKGRENYEYRNYIRECVADNRKRSDFFPERRFWSYIHSEVEKSYVDKSKDLIV